VAAHFFEIFLKREVLKRVNLLFLHFLIFSPKSLPNSAGYTWVTFLTQWNKIGLNFDPSVMPGGRMADSPTGNSMVDCYIGHYGAVFAIGFSCLIIPFNSAVRRLLDGS
jgi:hypothetical protein